MSAIDNIRVFPFNGQGKTVAFVTAKLNLAGGGAIFLNEMTLVNGKNGLFLSMPSKKLNKPDNKGNEYKDYYFMDRDAAQALSAGAIAEYQNKTGGGSFAGGGQQQGGGYGGQQQQGGQGYQQGGPQAPQGFSGNQQGQQQHGQPQGPPPGQYQGPPAQGGQYQGPPVQGGGYQAPPPAGPAPGANTQGYPFYDQQGNYYAAQGAAPIAPGQPGYGGATPDIPFGDAPPQDRGNGGNL